MFYDLFSPPAPTPKLTLIMLNVLQKFVLKFWEGGGEKCSFWPIEYVQKYLAHDSTAAFVAGKCRDNASNRSSTSLTLFRLSQLSLCSTGDQLPSSNSTHWHVQDYFTHLTATTNVSIAALANAVNLLDSLITSQPTASSSNAPPLALSLAHQTPSQAKIAGKVAETKPQFGE